MRIVSINDVQCNGKTPSEVTRLIKDREGRITISVDDEIQQANPEVIAEAYYPYSVPATAIDTNVDSEANGESPSYVPVTIIRTDAASARDDELPIYFSDAVVY